MPIINKQPAIVKREYAIEEPVAPSSRDTPHSFRARRITL